MKHNIDKLRLERLARLGKGGAKVALKASPAKPVVASGKPAVAPSKPSRVQSPKAPVAAKPVAAKPVVASKPEAITALVVDPATLSKSSNFDVSLYGETSEDPKWLVIADGTPVAEIHYQDQDNEAAAALPREEFATASFGELLHRAFKQEEPVKVLANLKARVYAASVAKAKAFAAVKKEVMATADEDIRLARADLRDNLMNVLGLVVTAQNKNFLSTNDLKAELHEQLTGIGMEPVMAAKVIEASWAKSASTYFEACFKQASEWMDLPAEAYAAIAKTIESAPHRMPDVQPVTASATDIPSAAHNVPVVVTAGASIPTQGVSGTYVPRIGL